MSQVKSEQHWGCSHTCQNFNTLRVTKAVVGHIYACYSSLSSNTQPQLMSGPWVFIFQGRLLPYLYRCSTHGASDVQHRRGASVTCKAAERQKLPRQKYCVKDQQPSEVLEEGCLLQSASSLILGLRPAAVLSTRAEADQNFSFKTFWTDSMFQPNTSLGKSRLFWNIFFPWKNKI